LRGRPGLRVGEGRPVLRKKPVLFGAKNATGGRKVLSWKESKLSLKKGGPRRRFFSREKFFTRGGRGGKRLSYSTVLERPGRLFPVY